MSFAQKVLHKLGFIKFNIHKMYITSENVDNLCGNCTKSGLFFVLTQSKNYGIITKVIGAVTILLFLCEYSSGL